MEGRGWVGVGEMGRRERGERSKGLRPGCCSAFCGSHRLESRGGGAVTGGVDGDADDASLLELRRQKHLRGRGIGVRHSTGGNAETQRGNEAAQVARRGTIA